MECKESSAKLGQGSSGLKVECKELCAELVHGSGGLAVECEMSSAELGLDSGGLRAECKALGLKIGKGSGGVRTEGQQGAVRLGLWRRASRAAAINRAQGQFTATPGGWSASGAEVWDYGVGTATGAAPRKRARGDKRVGGGGSF